MEQSTAEASASRPVYSIGAVAGCSAWSRRRFEPGRSGTGSSFRRSRGSHRLYSRDQVEHLRSSCARWRTGPARLTRIACWLNSSACRADVTVAGRDVVMLILLAERDRFAAELCEYFLRTEGYEVCLATNPADAERRVVERQPDLSVVELVMTGGLELCRRWLEARRPYSPCPPRSPRRSPRGGSQRLSPEAVRAPAVRLDRPGPPGFECALRLDRASVS